MAPGLGMMGTDRKKSGTGGLRKRDVASYMLLPKVLPRIADLFFTGFHFFAFFMAQVYRGVRLLPADHPSLNPANIGQFGIRDIIGSAARHLVWRRENIDQIIVFIAILLGLLLIVLQAATFVIAIAMPQALASTPSFGFSSIFGVPAGGATQDIAFILLDRVFGVPGVFNSCISSATPCYGVAPGQMAFDTTTTVYKPATFPWPYHNGLHALFQFYSMGLLLVGVFILLYLVIVIVAETAQTGTPFGKRFNTVWAPIRLVMAFGLLIPITSGLNSAQYITLYAAKWGSNFATNGWIVFNNALKEGNATSAENMAQELNLAVKPKEPDAAPLLQFMTLAHTCKVFVETTANTEKKKATAPPAATPAPTTPAPAPTTPAATPAAGGAAAPAAAAAAPKAPTCAYEAEAKGRKIEAYVVKPGYDPTNARKMLRGMSYDDARQFSENGNIQIRFGDLTCSGDESAAGNIEPVCGQLTIQTTSVTENSALSIQQDYFNLVKYMWGGFGTGVTGSIKSYENTAAIGNKDRELNACVKASYQNVLSCGSACDPKIREYALSYFQNGVGGANRGVCKTETHTEYENLPVPPNDWKAAAVQGYMYGNETGDESSIDQNAPSYAPYSVPQAFIIRNILKNGVRNLQEDIAAGEYNVSRENLRRGWAIAGIWYNKIAEMNGALIGAAWDLPTPYSYPKIMQTVANEKSQNNVSNSPDNLFCPNQADANINLPFGDNGRAYAQTMCEVYRDWNAEGRTMKPTGNAMSDFVNLIFGTQGLFDLRYQQNNRAHPLAMLVGVGKGLIEASIRNIGFGLGSGAIGIFANIFPGGAPVGEVASSISSFLFSIATMTLTAGFILFYVIPFLPFLYFFFAVGNWLKGVFEAMVGVPLWALAHLRIDGNGLPGEGAMNGYFMLFEIFLRPILILFGFLASITIFAAMATVLHEVFEVAVSNLTGAGTNSNAGGAIDNFFYTVMYAVIMYIMALSSFKLIDLIPNQIMRWMGTNVSTFSDMNQDVAGNLTNMTAIAGSQIVGGLTNGLGQGMKAIGGGAAQIKAGAEALSKQAAAAGKPAGN